jgi:hypothetical protein
MKFLITVTPRRDTAIPPQAVAAMLSAQRDWMHERINDRTIEFAYGFTTGGGCGVVNVDSHEALSELLMKSGFPDLRLRRAPTLGSGQHDRQCARLARAGGRRCATAHLSPPRWRRCDAGWSESAPPPHGPRSGRQRTQLCSRAAAPVWRPVLLWRGAGAISVAGRVLLRARASPQPPLLQGGSEAAKT